MHNNQDVIRQYTTFVIAKPQQLLWLCYNKSYISMDYTLIWCGFDRASSL